MPINRLLYLYVMLPGMLIRNQLLDAKANLVKKYNILSIGLFGSVVRSDFSTSSDVDILVDFTQPIGIEFIDLANELENLLHRKVDLVSAKGIKPQYFQEIQSDLVYV